AERRPGPLPGVTDPTILTAPACGHAADASTAAASTAATIMSNRLSKCAVMICLLARLCQSASIFDFVPASQSGERYSHARGKPQRDDRERDQDHQPDQVRRDEGQNASEDRREIDVLDHAFY